ncbi:OB-fold nucleic acid binding domain protein [Enterococcus faecalis]|nr:OB-fold nucleic acid binding domain protein [Enterococcus faecalis]
MFGAKKDVKIPTENGIYASGQITPMMNKEGNQLLYFTDFTSSEKDQDSALGYSLINARNRPSYVLS